MSASKDTTPLFDFNGHQPRHGLSLKCNSERSLRQPVRFTSKSVLAEIPATPAKGVMETHHKAVDPSNRDLNDETPPLGRTGVSNNRSTIAAKAKTTDTRVLKNAGGSTTRNTLLPVAVTPAHSLKRKLSSITTAGISNSKCMAEHDPANHEIKRLREEKGLKWYQIADILNKKLIAEGKSPAFTHNGVYSRYTRNAPRIAAMEAWPSGQDEMLVRAYHEVQAEMLEELWHRVSAKIVEAGGEKIAPDACALRYNSL